MSNSGVDITEIDWLKVSEFASVSELSETHTADSSVQQQNTGGHVNLHLNTIVYNETVCKTNINNNK